MDPEELVASVTFHEAAGDAASAAALTPAEQESRQAFWFYLLLALFVVMALETILGNRLSRSKTL